MTQSGTVRVRRQIAAADKAIRKGTAMELHLAWVRNEGDGFDLIAVDCPDGGAWTADQDLEHLEAGYSGTAQWLTITVPRERVAALFADGDDEDE